MQATVRVPYTLSEQYASDSAKPLDTLSPRKASAAENLKQKPTLSWHDESVVVALDASVVALTYMHENHVKPERVQRSDRIRKE